MDFRVSTLPDPLRREGRPAPPGQGEPPARHDQAGLRAPRRSTDFERAILLPYGMVLVTGPTGSGKTTTLYSALNRLNTTDTNIMTAEDPVEFNLPGINQVQIKAEIGLTFAAALRSFLRQDPDIIMVGEIRDYETAEIAVKAALTGHLVLSTLHTNDAPSTISRLLNMGVEPFLVAASTNVIVAQRLARRVCQACKEAVPVPAQALANVGFSPEDAKTIKPVKGKGCMTCSDTGYKGRVALYEVMLIKDNVKEAILQGASAMELRELGRKNGMQTLREAGLQKIREGMTTVEEVLRVTTGHMSNLAAARSGRTGSDHSDAKPARALEGDDRQGGLGPAHHHRGPSHDPPRTATDARWGRTPLAPAETKSMAYSILTEPQKQKFEEQ